MKLSDYMQKQKEQKEVEAAKKRYEEAQEKLKSERKKWRQEHPPIIVKQFKSLKPWTRSDIILLVLMLVLFSLTYFRGDSSFSFGFGSTNIEKLSANVVDESAESTTDEEQEEEVSSTEEEKIIEESTDEESTTEEVATEAENPVEVTLSALYNDKEFTSLSINKTDIAWFYLVFDNKEASEIRCEGTSSYLTKEIPSNFLMDANKKKSIATKVTAEEANTKVVVKNEFECYKEDQKSETLNNKLLRLTFHFGELS